MKMQTESSDSKGFAALKKGPIRFLSAPASGQWRSWVPAMILLGSVALLASPVLSQSDMTMGLTRSVDELLEVLRKDWPERSRSQLKSAGNEQVRALWKYLASAEKKYIDISMPDGRKIVGYGIESGNPYFSSFVIFMLDGNEIVDVSARKICLDGDKCQSDLFRSEIFNTKQDMLTFLRARKFDTIESALLYIQSGTAEGVQTRFVPDDSYYEFRFWQPDELSALINEGKVTILRVRELGAAQIEFF